MNKLFTFLMLTLLAGCATRMHAVTDHDASQDFSHYDTYAWVAPERMIAPAGEIERVSALNRRRIVDAIEAELKTKGFRKLEDGAAASFTIAYTVGARDRIDVYSFPDMYHHPWPWGHPYFGREVNVTEYTEGTLAIDVFDGASKRPVWHGRTSRRISEQDVQRAAELIPEAVREILRSFPPPTRTALRPQ